MAAEFVTHDVYYSFEILDRKLYDSFSTYSIPASELSATMKKMKEGAIRTLPWPIKGPYKGMDMEVRLLSIGQKRIMTEVPTPAPEWDYVYGLEKMTAEYNYRRVFTVYFHGFKPYGTEYFAIQENELLVVIARDAVILRLVEGFRGEIEWPIRDGHLGKTVDITLVKIGSALTDEGRARFEATLPPVVQPVVQLAVLPVAQPVVQLALQPAMQPPVQPPVQQPVQPVVQPVAQQPVQPALAPALNVVDDDVDVENDNSNVPLVGLPVGLPPLQPTEPSDDDGIVSDKVPLPTTPPTAKDIMGDAEVDINAVGEDLRDVPIAPPLHLDDTLQRQGEKVKVENTTVPPRPTPPITPEGENLDTKGGDDNTAEAGINGDAKDHRELPHALLHFNATVQRQAEIPTVKKDEVPDNTELLRMTPPIDEDENIDVMDEDVEMADGDFNAVDEEQRDTTMDMSKHVSVSDEDTENPSGGGPSESSTFSKKKAAKGKIPPKKQTPQEFKNKRFAYQVARNFNDGYANLAKYAKQRDELFEVKLTNYYISRKKKVNNSNLQSRESQLLEREAAHKVPPPTTANDDEDIDIMDDDVDIVEDDAVIDDRRDVRSQPIAPPSLQPANGSRPLEIARSSSGDFTSLNSTVPSAVAGTRAVKKATRGKKSREVAKNKKSVTFHNGVPAAEDEEMMEDRKDAARAFKLRKLIPYEDWRRQKAHNERLPGQVLVDPQEHFYRELFTDDLGGSTPDSPEIDIVGCTEPIPDHLNLSQDIGALAEKVTAKLTEILPRPQPDRDEDDDDNDEWSEDDLKKAVAHNSEERCDLLDKLLVIITSQRLANLSVEGQKGAQAKLYNTYVKHAHRLVQYFPVFSENRREETAWAHRTLIRLLPSYSLPVYLELCRFLRFINSEVADELARTLLEREVDAEWDAAFQPTMTAILSEVTGKPVVEDTVAESIDRSALSDVVAILVYPIFDTVDAPEDFVMENRPCDRMFSLIQQTAGECKIVRPLVPPGEISVANAMDSAIEQVAAMVKKAVHYKRKKRVVLFGWGLSCYINHRVVHMCHGISAVVNFAFALKTLDGWRGTPDDDICLTYCPSLFVIGAEAHDFDPVEFLMLRNNMQRPVGALVIGEADKNLNVSLLRLSRERITQSAANRMILEQVIDFILMPGNILDYAQLVPIPVNNVDLLERDEIEAYIRTEKERNDALVRECEALVVTVRQPSTTGTTNVEEEGCLNSSDVRHVPRSSSMPKNERNTIAMAKQKAVVGVTPPLASFKAPLLTGNQVNPAHAKLVPQQPKSFYLTQPSVVLAKSNAKEVVGFGNPTVTGPHSIVGGNDAAFSTDVRPAQGPAQPIRQIRLIKSAIAKQTAVVRLAPPIASLNTQLATGDHANYTKQPEQQKNERGALGFGNPTVTGPHPLIRRTTAGTSSAVRLVPISSMPKSERNTTAIDKPTAMVRLAPPVSLLNAPFFTGNQLNHARLVPPRLQDAHLTQPTTVQTNNTARGVVGSGNPTGPQPIIRRTTAGNTFDARRVQNYQSVFSFNGQPTTSAMNNPKVVKKPNSSVNSKAKGSSSFEGMPVLVPVVPDQAKILLEDHDYYTLNREDDASDQDEQKKKAEQDCLDKAKRPFDRR